MQVKNHLTGWDVGNISSGTIASARLPYASLFKRYENSTVGATVSGGVSPTVNYLFCIPEQDMDGNWYLSGRGRVTRASAASTGFIVSIPGITWDSEYSGTVVNGWNQHANVADREYLFGRTNAGNTFTLAPVSGQSVDNSWFEFTRIPITAKPTWAD